MQQMMRNPAHCSPPVLHITNEDKFGLEICDPGEARVQKQAARRFQSLMAARSGDHPDHLWPLCGERPLPTPTIHVVLVAPIHRGNLAATCHHHILTLTT